VKKIFAALLAALLVTTLSPAASPGQGGGATRTGDGVQLDFQDAELRHVLAALAEAGGLNIVYGDVPARRVTLRTQQPVSPENALALMRNVAAANGVVLVEEDGFVRVESAAGGGPMHVPGGYRPPDHFPSAGDGLRLHVHRLKHARADRMAATLQSVFGGSRGGSAAAETRPPLSEALRDHRVNPGAPRRPDALPDPILQQMGPSLPVELRGDVHIVADESANALLIRAGAADWEVIRQAIDALDLRPLQVLIEVLIVEVRRTRETALGVSFDGRHGPNRAGSAFEGAMTPRTEGDVTLRIMGAGGLDLNLALSALATTGRVRILSRPILLAQNNQEARMLVGAQIPFVQVFRSLPTEGAFRDQIVQYRDVGTALTIRPTINPDGYVNLQVQQEVSTATNERSDPGVAAPVISTRETSTHLFVRDGRTAVLGGLIERQTDRVRWGIPLLRDIPLIGLAFGGFRTTAVHNELFLFLTPRIIESDEDAERVREEMREQAPLLRREFPRGVEAAEAEWTGAEVP
jgi:general secretion pathway protein D